MMFVEDDWLSVLIVIIKVVRFFMYNFLFFYLNIYYKFFESDGYQILLLEYFFIDSKMGVVVELKKNIKK